jgi:hypothetical protein
MNRKHVIMAAALIAVATFGALYNTTHRSIAPRGQSPLVSLVDSNLDSFKASFNQSSDSIRVLLLLSPT